MKFSCVILAAGDGLRFGAKKQFIEWRGRELWEYSCDVCEKVSDDVIVVGVDFPGGKTRQESVFKGIRKAKYEKVVIVEAARPLVTSKQIKDIGLNTYPSVSYVMKSTDTILYKKEHLNRDYCYRLQVPQSFDTKMLIEAHENTKMVDATDDTILMVECLDIRPKLIDGGYNLFKVTYPEDLRMLEVIK